jgi:hypothetical protein
MITTSTPGTGAMSQHYAVRSDLSRIGLPGVGVVDSNGMHGVYEVERIDLRSFAYAATGSSIHTFNPGLTFCAHKRPWCTLTAR